MAETRRVSIIVPDNMVVIDGKPHEVDCSGLVGIHAVQWQGERGHVEYRPGDEPRGNDEIVSMADYAAIIAAWDAAENAPPPPPPPPLVAASADVTVDRIAVLERALLDKGVLAKADVTKAEAIVRARVSP